jgi:four helix bundle protein
MSGIRRHEDLRAWQACDRYKRAVYRACVDSPLSRDWTLRRQIKESVAGPPAHLAEGFGRFNPPDSARYAIYARSSLMESKNHVKDAEDKGHISRQTRNRLDELAEAALAEVSGYLDYLQSPEALENVRRIKERRAATRNARRQARRRKAGPGT